MNVLFAIKKSIHSSQEPLGILYLSSVLKKNNHQVYLTGCSLKKIIKLIKEKKIDIFAISCMNTDFVDYLLLSKKIKEKFPQLLIVWGGATPTYNPEIINEAPIDIICRGEGETAFLELNDRLVLGKDITDIPNLWLKINSKIYKNEVGSLLCNLDLLPLPDHSLTKKFAQFKYSSIKTLMASRGCPFNCSFCFNYDFKKIYAGKGAIIRTRSVSNVIYELKELKEKYGAKFIYFLDDVFPFEKEWVSEFSARYLAEINLPFSIITSVAFVNEFFVENLKKAGCVSVHIAVESGNDKIRREILFKPITNIQIINAARLAKKYGLGISTYNMIGIPFTTFSDDLETLDLNLEIGADNSYASFCLPFLNTRLGKMALDAGLVKKETEFHSWFEEIPCHTPEKNKLEKLGYYFPIIVAYPSLRPHLETLLKIPFPNFFLRFLKDVVNGLRFKQKIIPVKTSFKEFFFISYYFLVKRFTK